MKKLILSLLTMSILSVAQASAHDISRYGFKEFDCNDLIMKEMCKKYEDDINIYIDRKENFKKNRVKYFFSPNKLIDGFSTPEVFSKLMDETFRNLKKEEISGFVLSEIKKMSNTLDNGFKKQVSQYINDDNKKDQDFVDYYKNSFESFKRKKEIFDIVTESSNKVKEFQSFAQSQKGLVSSYEENKINSKDFSEKLEKNSKTMIQCLYVEYELLRFDLDKSFDCKK